MNILVTGGAGYIGSHAVKRLHADGHDVVALDNLYRGHQPAVPDNVTLAELDLRDTDGIETLLKDRQIDCVMNFAALAYVGESVTEPLEYYANNTAGVLSLMTAMDRAGVRRMVHSSTCATYGEPETVPITEDTPQSPINPYGWSKLFVERMLIDYANANPDFAFAALRYFNVAGSARDGSIGEDHTPETHLIPVMLLTALGQREKMTIFGTDYDTPDGTCIRDYIHVEDLIDAHATVMDALDPGDQRFYNLGIGNGLSVKQLIDAAKKVTGIDFKVDTGDRRPGDPPMLYADASKIERELGWKAAITDVHDMIESAWNWFKDHTHGYPK
ncbi:UDP-glucose 4-epimerase GalE [Mucisphaera sp.]|uniref:UDP-glucose 4-epimerase GalE n=1 Tax=Mucisphaera sp. TaxID=2913024 RepID=UPI003D0E88DC